MNRVAGKVALISGGASGLGKAQALLLAQQGAKVVVTDLNEGDGQAVADEIVAAGGEAQFLRQDVRNESEWEAVMSATLGRFGRLDVVVRSTAGSRLNDFSVRLLDAETRTQVRFLRSIDADSDGTFSDIPVGTYLASLAPAFLGAPELYTENKQRQPVTISEGATATVQFAVELCGRVVLRVDKPDAAPEQRAILTIRNRDGSILHRS